ncbi:MAG: AAA family ATPase [bacterium]
MITRISIENFKGTGDQTVVVPIRPITLLFGPNSAGKSTIMHAVHYARKILERHNLDADRMVAGGDCVNLGGFREFVHRKDKARQIKLRFDLDLSGVAWHEAFPVDEFLHEYRVGTASDDLSTLGLDVMSGSVELVVGFDEPERATQPVVLKYSVGLDEQHLASLVYVPYERTSDADGPQLVPPRLSLARARRGVPGARRFLFPTIP